MTAIRGEPVRGSEVIMVWATIALLYAGQAVAWAMVGRWLW